MLCLICEMYIDQAGHYLNVQMYWLKVCREILINIYDGIQL